LLVSRMKAVLALLALCAVATALRSGNFENVEGYTFEEYVEDFGKVYTSLRTESSIRKSSTSSSERSSNSTPTPAKPGRRESTNSRT